MEIIIHDKRPEKDFNSTTFSNFRKSDVIKTFIESMNNHDAENALSWCVELLCSSRLKDIWDCFLVTMGKHVRTGNPKLAIYIAKRFEKFKEIIGIGYGQCEIETRNSEDMRKLLCEMTLVICFSPKKPALEMLKVKKATDFTLDTLGTNLKADNMNYCKKILRDGDPSEILLAVNEFAYHFNKKNILRCCYWVDWMIDFDTLCRKQKKPIIIVDRDFIKVDDKFRGDPIWLFWELLLNNTMGDANKSKIVRSLLDLFCIKYNFSQKKKRRHLIYLGIELYTETLNMNIPMLHQSEKIKTIMPQIFKFFKAIKKYEQKPDVINDKQRNLVKSIDKMKMLYDI
jgi:hypothetical protein